MGDDRGDTEADKLDRAGEEPAAESGAGYGDHAPSAGSEDDTQGSRAPDQPVGKSRQ